MTPPKTTIERRPAHQPAVSTALLVDAARFALRRVTVAATDLRDYLLVDIKTAERVADRLFCWGILSRQHGTQPRMVLLLPALEAVVAGTITRHGGTPPLHNPLLAHAHPGLTDRGRAVLDLVAEGYGNAEIGEQVHVSPTTVKTDVDTLCRALNARNRIHLVTLAHQRGLLPNPHKSTVGADGAR